MKDPVNDWTRRHLPLNIHMIIQNCDEFDEDKYTLKMMKEFGINNVRGGSFSDVHLNANNIDTIKRMIGNSCSNCYICGSKEHLAKDCAHEISYLSEIYDISIAIISGIFDTGLTHYRHCYRCNKYGHYGHECYEITTFSGEPLDESYVCKYCLDEYNTADDLTYHEHICNCKNKQVVYCEKCGKTTHHSVNCTFVF
jgi:hypothetical protein